MLFPFTCSTQVLCCRKDQVNATVFERYISLHQYKCSNYGVSASPALQPPAAAAAEASIAAASVDPPQAGPGQAASSPTACHTAEAAKFDAMAALHAPAALSPLARADRIAKALQQARHADQIGSSASHKHDMASETRHSPISSSGGPGLNPHPTGNSSSVSMTSLPSKSSLSLADSTPTADFPPKPCQREQPEQRKPKRARAIKRCMGRFLKFFCCRSSQAS